MMKFKLKWVAHLLITLMLAGCANFPPTQKVDLQQPDVRIEDSLSRLQKAVIAHPDDKGSLADYIREKDRVINYLLLLGDHMHDQGNDADASSYYYRVLAIDSENARAKEGVASIDTAKRQSATMDVAHELFDKGDLDGANARLQTIFIENPKHADALALRQEIEEKQAVNTQMLAPALKSKFKQPISLQFRDANLKMVFEALSRTSGINILLDHDVKSDLKTTIFVKDASVEDTIDLILMQNQLSKKVLNDSTVFVYPSTPAKLKEYQDLVIRTFHLTNADAKQMQTMIKTMLKTKDIFVHEKTNSLVMRDTPEAIQLAEKLIASQDINEPEVMLEVEVLEVSHSRLTELGVKWPSSFSASITPVTLEGLKHINSGNIDVTPLSVLLNLRQEGGETNLLASPRIRVKQHEKAKILIGDRVPVITNSVTPVSTGTPVVTGSVSYLDVGLKLEVEPDIHMDGEVAIKTYLEVSSIAKTVVSDGGTIAYQIGTRNATTVLRLKDGERQVLGGLINDEDRKASASVPGLGDLPIIGHLFGSHKDDKGKTEIIMSITPHIIRNIHRPEADLAEFWSGTDETLRSKPLSLQSVGGTMKTGAPSVPVQAPAVPQAPMRVQVPVTPPPAPVAPSAQPKVQAPQAAAQPVSPTAPPKAQVVAKVAPTATQTLAPGKILPGFKPAVAPLALSLQGATQAKVGDQFKIVVYAQSGGVVVATPINVTFDPAAMEVVDVSEGDFLKSNNTQTTFSGNIDQPGGQVIIDNAQPGKEGAAGRGSLAVITFRATAASSQAPITVTGSATNAAGDAVPVTSPAAHNVLLIE